MITARAKDPEDESRGQKPFVLVGIGASAGGLEAFKDLLGHLPSDTGMAFLLVQHLDPTHESHLTEVLAKVTALPVLEATHGVEVRPDHVYVIPPNASMAVAEGHLHISPRAEGRGPHLPVDFLFRSLAEDQRARAIAVVLSGSGSDGTLGLCEVKAVGGITFAQDEKTAKHTGMPHSAIESHCVDFVLPPEEIAKRLIDLGHHPYLNGDGTPAAAELDTEVQFKRVLAVIRAVMGVDFSMYRDSTIKRRIMRRMALHIQQSWSEYVDRLESDRKEVEALYHDLLINVTSFFRDADLFEALKLRVFPELLRNKSPGAPIRAWVPGCSTGQEAYSLAISLIEFYDDKPIRPRFQIFATDLSDATALDKARAGLYPESIEAEVSPERLGRFFKKEDHLYRIDKAIRDQCVFARQNVTADPPFSHLDLISCRNLLIYLSTPLQRRVLPTFHYALNSPGFLVLGSAETVGENNDLFELIDRGNRIYVKKSTAVRLPAFHAAETVKSLQLHAARRYGTTGPSPVDFQREADRVLLGRYSPPGVLINENQDIVQYRGRTSPYLEAPPGEPTTNVLKMAREGLFLELRSALNEAQKQNQVVHRQGLRVRVDQQLREISLEVVPIRPPGTGEACFLILFHDEPSSGSGESRAVPVSVEATPLEGDQRELMHLRQELAATKEYLQAMVEQQDAVNEELRSANEEVMSSNEELQSTNEELETAKEELQSVNEELTTVNEQLQQRNQELTSSNNDLTNLLSSTDIPVMMVGSDLRIRRFTAPAKKFMGLLPTDLGRPIQDTKLAGIVPDLESLIETVIDEVQPQEREVFDRDARCYEMRVYPYRTSAHKVEGAVIVLVDIDRRKRAEEGLREADRRKDEFLATLAHELRNPLAPIYNVVETMRRGGDDPAIWEKTHDVLFRQVRQLSRIVEDLIDVSRIVEKKIELRPERITLDRVLEMALESCRSSIEGRQHRLSVTLPSERVFLNADPVRLAQVVINLLNNAAKYTEPGGKIDVSAELRRERGPSSASARRGIATNGSATHVVLSVRDTGMGIQPELLPRVFDMFTQTADHQIHNRGGLGVGLTLARSLAQMHGGELIAQSAGPGRGSEFILRLPLAGENASESVVAAHPAPAEPLLPRRILVVDDNHDQAETLGMLLKFMGHEVRLAFDGPTAVDAVEAFRPDIALVDIGMPGLSGYDVARRIRQQPHNKDLVLIAQTGWGQEKDRRRSIEAGFDHHLIKPVEIATLQRIMASAPPTPRDPESEASDEDTQPGAS